MDCAITSTSPLNKGELYQLTRDMGIATPARRINGYRMEASVGLGGRVASAHGQGSVPNSRSTGGPAAFLSIHFGKAGPRSTHSLGSTKVEAPSVRCPLII